MPAPDRQSTLREVAAALGISVAADRDALDWHDDQDGAP
ncbi:hypothetical protein SAMN05421693_11416 [Ectothiorhodospira magna]|uniref:Uncharacterized protein n=1 Tax=Ectothiorhodospira magna TaxID=867345 RepID=A0A1H9CKI4_9GAMM|nr:hypothetical protein SAMN05421693_11416 [Ectothiorhodospira magna]